MLRFAFWTFIGTAGVLTAAAGGAAWLVGTESGRSAALNLAVRFVPGFEAQAISGPWDDLTLKGIGWMSPGISAKIDELHLGWDWRALFQHSLHVAKLEVVGADIKVDTTALPASEDAPADYAAGLPDLQRLRRNFFPDRQRGRPGCLRALRKRISAETESGKRDERDKRESAGVTETAAARAVASASCISETSSYCNRRGSYGCFET